MRSDRQAFAWRRPPGDARAHTDIALPARPLARRLDGHTRASAHSRSPRRRFGPPEDRCEDPFRQAPEDGATSAKSRLRPGTCGPTFEHAPDSGHLPDCRETVVTRSYRFRWPDPTVVHSTGSAPRFPVDPVGPAKRKARKPAGIPHRRGYCTPGRSMRPPAPRGSEHCPHPRPPQLADGRERPWDP